MYFVICSNINNVYHFFHFWEWSAKVRIRYNYCIISLIEKLICYNTTHRVNGSVISGIISIAKYKPHNTDSLPMTMYLIEGKFQNTKKKEKNFHIGFGAFKSSSVLVCSWETASTFQDWLMITACITSTLPPSLLIALL